MKRNEIKRTLNTYDMWIDKTNMFRSTTTLTTDQTNYSTMKEGRPTTDLQK